MKGNLSHIRVVNGPQSFLRTVFIKCLDSIVLIVLTVPVLIYIFSVHGAECSKVLFISIIRHQLSYINDNNIITSATNIINDLS